LSYDLVIRNGYVVDGTGGPRYPADVAVLGDRIAAIGHVGEKGRREIDAQGRAVTPGFIDGHTHMDAQIFWDPQGTCSCWHGVTTVVMGNCGFTLAPAAPAGRALLLGNLERAEAIPKEALEAGIEWRWRGFPEFLDSVDALPKAINYAANIGHSALRIWAMGEAAYERPANDDELARMEGELRSALRAGAIGFSTTQSQQHETADGRPVASRLASWEEISRLVEAIGSEGGGLFQFAFARTPAREGAASDEAAPDQRRLIELSARTGVVFTYGIVTAEGLEWKSWLSLLDSGVESRARMFGQVHTREITLVLSFLTQLPYDRLPGWRDVRSRPIEDQLRLLTDPQVRKALVRAAEEESYPTVVGTVAKPPDYRRIMVLDHVLPPYVSVADVAAQRSVTPVEVILDLAVQTDMHAMFLQVVGNHDPSDVITLMRHSRTIPTFSDSGAHVSQLIDSSLGTHLLAYWVRERELFSLEEAVRKLTLDPAMAWGFWDRGHLRVGATADINVFDPLTVGPELPTVEHDLPGGATRLVQRARGFQATVVGGEVTIANGEFTGALPGRIVRRREPQ
jgi:N-acyl-D-aspartate/D-glutamate deacylase